MGTLLQSRFHTLCISSTIDCRDECLFYNWNVPDKNLLWTDSIDIAHDFVLKAGGESFRTLIIGKEMYNRERDGTNLIGNFLRSCPNVSSLSVVEPYGAWACAFAQQLEKLEVVSVTSGVTFPKYCPLLRELNYNFEYINWEIITPEDIKGVDWQHTGKNLERLTLCGVTVSQNELDEMRKHCTKLKYLVMILQSGGNNGDIAKFYLSYGDQLDFICIDDMMKGELKHVAANCSKARFHVHLHRWFHGSILPTLSALGPRLVGATLHWQRTTGINTREWAATWKICNSLKVLILQELPVAYIRAIMSTPKYHLKELRISIVEIIHFHFYEHDPSLSDLDKFIDKNKSTLKSFCVTNEEDAPFPESDIGKMLKKVSYCPRLQEISLDQVPARRLLRTFRKRGIHFRQPTSEERGFRFRRYELGEL